MVSSASDWSAQRRHAAWASASSVARAGRSVDGSDEGPGDANGALAAQLGADGRTWASSSDGACATENDGIGGRSTP